MTVKDMKYFDKLQDYIQYVKRDSDLSCGGKSISRSASSDADFGGKGICADYDSTSVKKEYVCGKSVNRSTKRYAVIGNPVCHSLSPALHGIAFPEDEYVSVRVLEGELKQFFSFARQYLSGFNVTVPHKRSACEYVDVADELSKQTHSVNTVSVKGGRLYGFNTDIYGITQALTACLGSLYGKTAIVLGAGGAAAGVCLALSRSGARAVVAARDTQKAQKDFEDYEVIDFGDIYQREADILINCTPVGLSSLDKNAAPADAARLKGRYGFIYDTIYSPLSTALLRAAKSQGIPCKNGLGMLVYQALKSREHWGSGDAAQSAEYIIAALSAVASTKKLKAEGRSIALCGFMGSGKSTVAKLAGEMSGWRTIDTDTEIERENRLPVQQIFTKRGEQYFRSEESRVIKRLKDLTEPAIISLGGGAAANAANVEILREFCIIIYLDAPFEECYNRAAQRVIASRPLLQKGKESARQLYEERRQLYRAAADITIDGSNLPLEIVREIFESV